MCISTGNFDLIYFLGIISFLNLEIWPKWKLLLVFCPIAFTNVWNCHSLYTAFSSNMLERGVCELAHSFFNFFKIFTMDWYPQLVWSHDVVYWGQSKALASYCFDIYLTFNEIPRVHFISNLKNMLNFQISQLFSLCAHIKYMIYHRHWW